MLAIFNTSPHTTLLPGVHMIRSSFSEACLEAHSLLISGASYNGYTDAGSIAAPSPAMNSWHPARTA